MSITRNDPKPGEFLFIGGPADGDRREITQPYKTIRVVERVPMPSISMTEPPHTADVPPYTEYNLTRLSGEQMSFFVYLHEPLNGDDLMKALLRRYTGGAK